MKITTSEGFECEINERKFTDYRFLQLMRKFYSKDETEQFDAMSKLVPYVLGNDQEDSLVEFCSDETGYADQAKVLKTFEEIFDAAKEESQKAKKS